METQRKDVKDLLYSRRLLMKMVGHIIQGPIGRIFGGNSDLDSDPRMFRRNFTIAILAVVKTPHRALCNSPNKRR